MRLTTAIILGCLVILSSGCASRNVAVVSDNDLRAPKVWDSASHQVNDASINEDDRLVIFGISHKNPLLFRNELNFRQYPKAKEGRSYLTIYPEGKEGDTLVLLKFKADAGETAYLQPLPCKPSTNTWCVFTRSADESHVTIALPKPGQILYAGRLYYEIEDQFPHRGTQNHALVKQLKVTNTEEQDIPTALQKWSLLKNRVITKDMAKVHKGRAKVFVVGSKEFNE